ncbi:MAG: UMP kinase [Thermoprotei archaeon]|nr:MAG: UMP kinase [Thermoprotei archaeon]
MKKGEVMRIVIKVSGHLISRREEVFDGRKLLEYADCIKILLEKGHRVVAVVGGGYLARAALTVTRRVDVSESIRDLIGIEAARLNAKILASLLYPHAPLKIPSSVNEVIDLIQVSRAVCVGGFQPGQSTTAVAALCAEAIGADLLLITTDVEGVYDRDPKKFPDAKLLKEVSVETLEKILAGGESLAGTYKLFDKVALIIISRSRIPARVVKGDKETILGVVEGRDYGTLIVCK